MKPVMVLAIALFGISAPAPDSRDIAEMTSNFIVPSQAYRLHAAEGEPGKLPPTPTHEKAPRPENAAQAKNQVEEPDPRKGT